MKNYLLYVTFCAGSCKEEDTDTRLYVLSIEKEMDKVDILEMFEEVNALLDPYDRENNNFPISYEQGLNIDTLMEGVEIYAKGKVREIEEDNGNNTIGYIDNFYEIEQWQ